MKYQSIISLVVILVCVISPFIILPKVLKVKSLQCTTQFGSCSDQFPSINDELIGKSLDTVHDVLHQKLPADPMIESFSTRVKLPSTLVISINKRVPRYAVSTDATQIAGLVDNEGRVVYFDESTVIPILFVDSVPNIHEFVNQDILTALRMIYRFSQYYDIQSARMQSDYYEIYLQDGKKVYLPINGDQDILAGSLVVVLSRLKQNTEDFRISGSEVHEIDLRFDNPVLR